MTEINIIDNHSKKNKLGKILIKYGAVFAFIFFTTLLVSINLTFVVKSEEKVDIWFYLALISSLFGMLNVMTYSLYNPNSIHKNKFMVFILFNSIAVISLAAVNIHNDLYFLCIENLAFFLSGLYQFYMWFIKKNISKDEDSFDYHLFKKYGWERTLLYLPLIIIGLIVVSSLVSGGFSYFFDKNSNWSTASPYLTAFIDGFGFSLSLVAAILVGRKSIESQWIYLISDIVLITWWLTKAINAPTDVEMASYLSTTILFGFYLTTNIINIYNWTPKKQRKTIISLTDV